MTAEPHTTRLILPIEGKTNVLVTAALPYSNNVPHLGNIIGSVLSADVFARFSRARGNQTLYVCGTDEYGTATETKALEEGIDPATLCERYHAIHKDIYNLFNISFDVFGRTPTPQHTEITQDIFRKLWENRFIEERETIYFLADRFIEGTCSICGYFDARGDQCDKCGSLLDPHEQNQTTETATDGDSSSQALDGSTPQPRKTKHCFIKLDELRLAFIDYSNGQSIIQAWLDKGLKARSISRDLKWGVPMPVDVAGSEYATKVFYVWFEAYIGTHAMVFSLLSHCEQWWKNPDHVQLHQFMGKDNTKIHRISTTKYLNYEGGKFSKSRGVSIFSNQIHDIGVPIDIWRYISLPPSSSITHFSRLTRYYLLARRPETSDAEFMWQEMVDFIKFCQAKTTRTVPDYTMYTDQYLQEHAVRVNEILGEYNSHLQATRLKAGLQTVMTLSGLRNKLLQDNQVNNRLLSEEPQRCAAVVGAALHQIHLLAHILSPYLPSTSTSILKQLNISTKPKIPDQWEQDILTPGYTLGTPKHLFYRIPGDKVVEWRDAFGGEEVRKQKEELLAKATKKKAAKAAQKLKKKQEGS
ncbi:hypothetical protein LCI18_008913 [Fusarium solani-melongenae]|uniref:Uncharacterized protein n=1 Tax=Fusarium solani subsp. cucurbitae TaxID=2747967 RepID=A0ACD3ZA79_FUSSC|nr:hypothetical protein LCI18_008913 [Fusarium solani-melongenae]